jgi:hypothetical protein
MNLQSSFWVMIFLQSMGSVDMPGKGARKLPSPRAYIATLVIWSILFLVGDKGSGNAARAAGAMGWLTVLAGLVVGPFGSQLVSLFNGVATAYAPVAPPSNASTGGLNP